MICSVYNRMRLSLMTNIGSSSGSFFWGFAISKDQRSLKMSQIGFPSSLFHRFIPLPLDIDSYTSTDPWIVKMSQKYGKIAMTEAAFQLNAENFFIAEIKNVKESSHDIRMDASRGVSEYTPPAML